MSRFDVLCVVRDEVDLATDRRLANFVVGSHAKHHPRNEITESEEPMQNEDGLELIPQDVLKKYIVYAKQNIKPKLHKMDQEKISKMYSQLRQEAMVSSMTEHYQAFLK